MINEKYIIQSKDIFSQFKNNFELKFMEPLNNNLETHCFIDSMICRLMHRLLTNTASGNNFKVQSVRCRIKQDTF